MTVASTSSSVVAAGNGVTTVFPFAFPVPSLAALIVLYTSAAGVVTQLPSSAFAVTGIGSSTGGTITYPLSGSPIPVGSTLAIKRVVSFQQTTSLVNQGAFYPSVVEAALDNLEMQIQQLAAQLGSAGGSGGPPLLFNAADINPVNVMPAAAARAGNFLTFDALGNPQFTVVAGGTGVSQATFNNTIGGFGRIQAKAANFAVHVADAMSVFLVTQPGITATLDTCAALAPFGGFECNFYVASNCSLTLVAGAGNTINGAASLVVPGNTEVRIFCATATTDVIFVECQGHTEPVIAVIGDSLTAQNVLIEDGVVTTLERRLRQMGSAVKVISCGRDAHTFFRANTVAFAGGLTSAQYVSLLNPTVIIVALGANDALLAVDGRTLAQTKTDADTLFTALAAACPNAKLLYASEVLYDDTNWTSATLTNGGTTPYFMTLRSSGILNGMFSSEILTDACSGATRTLFANWVSLDTYVKANVNLTASFKMHVWRACRLGGVGRDNLHPTRAGMIILAGYLFKGLNAAVPAIVPLWSNNYQVWEDPDTLFTTALTASGNYWVESFNAISEAQAWINNNGLRCSAWYLPYKGKAVYTQSFGNMGTDQFEFTLSDAPESTLVQSSVDGAALVSLVLNTDSTGGFKSMNNGHDNVNGSGLALGSHTLRWAVGNCMFGPYTVTIVQKFPGWIAPTLLGAWANFGGGYEPVGYYIDAMDVVHIRGGVAGGTGNIFTLPAGYRPPFTIILPSTSNSLFAMIGIDTSGNVSIQGGSNLSLGVHAEFSIH